mmetsp:Transcript_38314/g.59871  ORF Transcript_38314/g.59871 Transcript_38314/m.59871 type:complete len:125 (+) Transcript_38314:204-578(+)
MQTLINKIISAPDLIRSPRVRLKSVSPIKGMASCRSKKACKTTNLINNWFNQQCKDPPMQHLRLVPLKQISWSLVSPPRNMTTTPYPASHPMVVALISCWHLPWKPVLHLPRAQNSLRMKVLPT